MTQQYTGTRLQKFVSEVEAQLNDSTVLFRIGKEDEGQHGKRRRVHWYREGGTIEAPSQAGGRLNGDTDEATGSREPTAWERYERVTCGIFAESPATADTLLDNMIVAIDHTAPNGSVVWERYEWTENEIAQRVPLVRLVFSLKLPVVDEVKALTELTGEELTCQFD